MGTTNRNRWPYPEPNEAVAQGATNIRSLAQSIDLAPVVQVGSATLTMNAGVGTVAVVFPRVMPTVPTVILSPDAITGNTATVGNVIALSVNGFTVRIQQMVGLGYTGSLGFHWAALAG